MAESAAEQPLQEYVKEPEIVEEDTVERISKDPATEPATPEAAPPVPALDLKEDAEDTSEPQVLKENTPIVEKSDSRPASSQDMRPDSALSDKSNFSECSTPRDGDTSSGSPSPIPDDSPEGSARPKVCLGRDISLMMQALNSLHSPEEKIAALCKKYADLLEQHKLKEKQLRVTRRKNLQFVKEREQLQVDLNKAMFGKSKMESLARELNKDNKRLKEQLYNDAIRMDKEKERVSAKFQAATDEISGKINSISDRNTLLAEENRTLAGKIEKHVEDTAAREKTIKTLLEHRDLKEQILTLELKKAQEERDMSLGNQKKLVEEAEKSKALCEAFMKQEKEMKAQIEYYSEKFEDFQSTLDKSNQIFASFRTEMDRMTKKIKELEKGTAMWKKKWEENEAVVGRVAGEKAEQDRFVDQLKEKLARLTTLCRALQAERNELTKKVSRYEKKDKPTEAKAKAPERSRKQQNQSSESAGMNGLPTPAAEALDTVNNTHPTGGTTETPTNKNTEGVVEDVSSVEDPPTSTCDAPTVEVSSENATTTPPGGCETAEGQAMETSQNEASGTTASEIDLVPADSTPSKPPSEEATLSTQEQMASVSVDTEESNSAESSSEVKGQVKEAESN